MQKLVNVLAVLSFLMSGTIVGAGVYVYTQRDALIENAKEKLVEQISDLVGEAVTGSITETVGAFEITDKELGTDTNTPVPIPSLPF